MNDDPNREELEQRLQAMTTDELQALFAAEPDAGAEPAQESELAPAPQPSAVTNKGGGKIK